MATGPSRAYAYASAADLHSNCRAIRPTRHYGSVRHRATAAEKVSTSRNEVPKSPRERSIIEKVRALYLIHSGGPAKVTASPKRLFNNA